MDIENTKIHQTIAFMPIAYEVDDVDNKTEANICGAEFRSVFKKNFLDIKILFWYQKIFEDMN